MKHLIALVTGATSGLGHAAARLLAAELGLTPVSRSRPAIRDDGDGEDDSPLDM